MIKSKYIRQNHASRYDKSFFIDNKFTESIKTKGYVVVDLLNEQQIKELKSGYEEIAAFQNNDFGELFWPSGRSENTKIRNLAKQKIDAVLPIALKEYIKEDDVKYNGGTYLIKPPSDKSALSPHQDSAHVLENEAFSVYCWAPLQDVGKANGCLYVFPESHKINITQRSLSVPWAFREHIQMLQKYMEPIPLKAGQAIFFDAALIHASPPNFSNETRVAINFYIHPKHQHFCHYHFNKKNKKVEVFSVTPSFYYDEDFEKRPTNKYPLIEIQLPALLSINTNQVKAICSYINGKKIKSKFYLLLDKLGL